MSRKEKEAHDLSMQSSQDDSTTETSSSDGEIELVNTKNTGKQQTTLTDLPINAWQVIVQKGRLNTKDCLQLNATSRKFHSLFSPKSPHKPNLFSMAHSTILDFSHPMPKKSICLNGHQDYISCITVLPSGHLASGSWDKTVRIWDIKTGRCLQTLAGHDRVVSCLSVLSDNRIACGSGNDIFIWDINTGKYLEKIGTSNKQDEFHTNSVHCLSVLSGDRVATGHLNDGAIHIWDINTGKCLTTLHPNTSKRTRSLISLPNDRLACVTCDFQGASGRDILILDVKTGKCLKTLTGHEGSVYCLSLLSNGHLASGSADTTIKIWDITTGKCLKTLGRSHYCDMDEGHLSGMTSLTKKLLISYTQYHTIKMWELHTGNCLQTLEGREFSTDMTPIIALPDGLVSMKGSNIYINRFDYLEKKPEEKQEQNTGCVIF